MLDLEAQFPMWIMRGRFAPGLNLLMKAFCKFQSAFEPGAHDRTFGLKWAEPTVADANMMATFLQDSGSARNLVRSVRRQSIARGGQLQDARVHRARSRRWASI